MPVPNDLSGLSASLAALMPAHASAAQWDLLLRVHEHGIAAIARGASAAEAILAITATAPEAIAELPREVFADAARLAAFFAVKPASGAVN